MNAIPSPGTPGSGTGNRVRRAAVLLTLASLAAGSQVAAQQQAGAQEHTPAVLKLRETAFFYRSSAAHYSCRALQGRVASILLALGARHDLEVRVNGCDVVVAPQEPEDMWHSRSDPWQTSSDRWRTSSDRFRNRGARREQSAHVHVRVMMPIEVTAEVLEEIKRDKSRRELVSRVTGDPAASLDDPVVFPAQRQLVTLSRQTIDLRPEDCELLDQMSSSVFRELDLRVVGGRPACNRDQISSIPPKITVETLMPVMPRTPQLTPAGGESDPEPETDAPE